MVKKIRFLEFLILLAVMPLSAQKVVGFYATVSSSDDTNMLTMTTDLFYTQLQNMDGYSVVDCRSTPYTENAEKKGDIIFYAEIQEDNGQWSCTLHAATGNPLKAVQETRTYASYYKILLDAKASLDSILSKLNQDGQALQSKDQSDSTASGAGAASLDSLAGTWTGEQLIDKVIILRGGKGFVIFKNGASMTIAVSIKGTNVSVIQQGRSNASFYPEIARELALKNAATASPISWALVLVGESTLKGTKTTLVEDKSSSSGIAVGKIEVQWTKQ
ncbi:MAG: hypothetical protein J5857_12310 [Treponema sp.]|nr:hypothetical protein [Treponema sp.]